MSSLTVTFIHKAYKWESINHFVKGSNNKNQATKSFVLIAYNSKWMSECVRQALSLSSLCLAAMIEVSSWKESPSTNCYYLNKDEKIDAAARNITCVCVCVRDATAANGTAAKLWERERLCMILSSSICPTSSSSSTLFWMSEVPVCWNNFL